MIKKLTAVEVGNVNKGHKKTSSWAISAQVQIKARKRFNWHDKTRLYFSTSKAAAIKSFKNEFKIKQGANNET